MYRILIIIFLFLSCQNKVFKGNNEDFRIINIEGGTFDMPVTIIITKDIEKALSYVQENNDSSATKEDFDARGVTFSVNNGNPPIVWLPSIDSSPENVSILNHELLHANFSILNWAGVYLSDSTEEVFTYNYQFLTKKFYEKYNE